MMCAQHLKTKLPVNLYFVLYAVVIGCALWGGMSHISWIHQVGDLISNIFIKIFKFISLPIISLSIIVTLSTYEAANHMKKLWYRTLFYTISTTVLAASIAFVLYLVIAPGNLSLVSPESINMASANTSTNYLGFVLKLIPENFLSPFMEHQVTGVLLVSMIVGVAIRLIPDETAKHTVQNFFRGFHALFLIITGWVVRIIPLALFGFIVTTVVELKKGVNIWGLGGYLAVVVLANLVQGLVILPLILRYKGIKSYETLKKMMPALSMAFFSKSSAGTLPVTMKMAEQGVGVSHRVSRFVLPLCTSINMNGCAAFIFTTVIFVMQNHGLEISGMTMVAWIFIATLAAVGNAGVPMGCFFLSASLLTSMDVPIEIMGLILPFYSLIDMLETALNVWSDACVTVLVDQDLKKTVSPAI